jgi:hypothetical protein
MQGESVDVEILRTYPDMFDNTSKLNKDKEPELPGVDDSGKEEDTSTNPALVMHKELGLVLLVRWHEEEPNKVYVDPGNAEGPSEQEVLLSDLYTNDEDKIPLDQFDSEMIDEWISKAREAEVADEGNEEQEESTGEEELSDLEKQLLDILKVDEYTTCQTIFEHLPDANREEIAHTLNALKDRRLADSKIGGFWKVLPTSEVTETPAESATTDADYDPFDENKQDEMHDCSKCKQVIPDEGCHEPADGSRCPNYVPPAEEK